MSSSRRPNSEDSPQRDDFRPVYKRPAHEYVAEQIRRHIALGVQTDVLPPERELAARFAVGRATVQKALAILAADGLIEQRRGRHGGTFILQAPGQPGSNGDDLIREIQQDAPLIEEALTYRMAIEPAAAENAARRRTDTDIVALQNALAAITIATTEEEYMRRDTELHLCIARAGRNRFFLEEIDRLRVLLNKVFSALPESDVWHNRINREHASIVRAIADGDATAARRAMTAHVKNSDDSILALLRTG